MDAVECMITYASNINLSWMFDYLCMLSALILAVMTVVRAANVGFQKESYAISAIAYVPICYKMFLLQSNDMFILHIFYFVISIWAYFRWKEESKAQYYYK